ncbi:hypothetical protein GALMADRAFT_57870 [Galerina marginata CBS 339.88]|uniref:Vacuolar membrane protease C-terminal domain-containing protein n=1 Tax=Galerina marginata (strain CBS 339.88) TaxID=685588 RepID=A0A067TII1_GALM3|nr:hypothetical protein GALMADRAFT_57870 [Galerina marginata CBS 339.88]
MDSSSRLRVKGMYTRACRLYFDSSPVHEYSVRSSRRLSRVGPKGVKDVRLWSRTWENEFRVDVDWANGTHRGETVGMNGRIACEWEVGDTTPKIPALEEVLAFLPEWATVSKFGDGLVEAWTKFSV